MLLDYLIFAAAVFVALFLVRIGFDAIGMQPVDPAGKIAFYVMIFLMLVALAVGYMVFGSVRMSAGLYGSGAALAGIVAYLVARLFTYGDSDG